MTPLQQWQRMAMAENKRAARGWLGLENDKPVSLREITVVVAPGPGVSPEAKAFRKHMQRLYLDGCDPAAIAAQLACPAALVRTNLRGLDTVKPLPPRTKALRMRIQRLHLDGFAPDEIVAGLACTEAHVWKYLRDLYQEGRNRLSDDYRQMRVARIYALKQQGLALQEIAERMGVNKVLLNKDMRERPQKPAGAASRRENGVCPALPHVGWRRNR